MRAPVYMAIRLTLWTAGVAIPLFPTLAAAPEAMSLNLPSTLAKINDAGLFRDLFFVIVPAAAIAVATTIDFLCIHVLGTSAQKASATLGGVSLLLVLANTVALLSGFVGFLLIPPGHFQLSAGQFLLYSWIIGLGIAVSFVTELGISFAASSLRK